MCKSAKRSPYKREHVSLIQEARKKLEVPVVPALGGREEDPLAVPSQLSKPGVQ